MAEEIVTHSKKKMRISWKAIGIIAGIVTGIAAVITGVVLFTNWRNNGSAYAQRLGEEINASVETAQKYAHVTLLSASTYPCINMAAEEYPFLYESTRKTEVLGVKIPEWVIYIGATNNTVTEVLYYNYKQLQKYGTGIKADGKLDIQGITTGMKPEAVQQYIGFAPLCTAYTAKGSSESSKSFTESYKYWFRNADTDSTMSYTIRVTYENEIVKEVEEEEEMFIVPVLKAK